MSLLQRVERAQQAANAAANAQPPRPAPPAARAAPPPTALVPVVEPPRPDPRPAIAGPRGAAPRHPGRDAGRGRRRVRHARRRPARPRSRPRIEGIFDRVVTKHGFAVTRDERARLVEEMINDVTGFGPIEPLLHDESITEVMVNGPDHIYIERGGKILRVDSTFLNDEHVLRVIDRIITPMGRRIDETSPRVDARLPDGSRVNAIIEPLSLIGPVITVRKFSTRPYTVDDLIRFGTATPEMFEFLRACIEARLNLFVSGGTGSGKTTTLNVLSCFIPNDERIVTIEDAAELQLRQEHVITLESRPPNLEGEGEITIRNLLRNAMHMRPDRIIVGECRSGEALDMLQAMTTGHDGSLSTGHANSPRDMLRRLETMVLMTGYQLPLRAIREQIASAVDLIVHTARLKDGTRKIISMTEVYGIEDDEILTQDIFAFEQTGVREDGKIEGELTPTGHPADVHEPVRAQRRRAAARRVRHPERGGRQADRVADHQGALGRASTTDAHGQVGGGPRAGSRGRRPAAWSTSRRSGRSTPRRARSCPGRSRSTRASASTNLKAKLEARGQLARQGRLGELVAADADGLRRLQRGVGPLVPGRRAGRAGDADAAAPAPGRVPRLARGDRRGRLTAIGGRLRAPRGRSPGAAGAAELRRHERLTAHSRPASVATGSRVADRTGDRARHLLPVRSARWRSTSCSAAGC